MQFSSFRRFDLLLSSRLVKNHHHLYYPFFPLSSPLVVSHLITPRRKPLRHLSTRPIRRRRSSTRVSFPVARTSDFFDRCFPTSPFFPKKKKSQQLLFLRASQKLLGRRKQKKNTHSGGSLVSFSLLLLFSTSVVVLFSLSLSLSLSLCSPERREEEKKLLSSGEIILARSFYLKKTLSLFCGCEKLTRKAKAPKKGVKKREKHFCFRKLKVFFFVKTFGHQFCFFSLFLLCKNLLSLPLSDDTRRKIFSHSSQKEAHIILHERSTHTDDEDDSDDEFFERGSFSSFSRSRSGTKEAETPSRGNIMPL